MHYWSTIWLWVSSTFDLSDQSEYKEPALIPRDPFEPVSFFESDPFPWVSTSQIQRAARCDWSNPRQADQDHKGRFCQCYLVCWRVRSESKDSWLLGMSYIMIDQELLEYIRAILEPDSTESSFSHPRRIDEDIARYRPARFSECTVFRAYLFFLLFIYWVYWDVGVFLGCFLWFILFLAMHIFQSMS